MEVDFDIELFDDVFSFDNNIKDLILNGNYNDALVLLKNLLDDEKKQYENVKYFLNDLLGSSSDGDISEINEIEKNYNLLDVSSYRIRKLEELVTQLTAFSKVKLND